MSGLVELLGILIFGIMGVAIHYLCCLMVKFMNKSKYNEADKLVCKP